MKKYSDDIEDKMRILFFGYNEKQKRIYAALEAEKLGHGGIKYISEVLGISPRTIYEGKKDLAEIKKNN